MKQATTFIRTDRGEGTGFLIERKASEGIVATAAHVVADGKTIRPTVQVFFSSGTQEEYSFKASVLAIDVRQDIAFLKITASNLPEPLFLAPDVALTETMDVVIAGFPFGGQISVGTKNPSLTISKGSISSIKQSVTDSITLLQLDVSVNPGNSGGPVINSQGEVIGIISAKIEGTQLGFAIPVSTVYRDYMGDCAEVSGDLSKKWENKQVTLRGQLVDPLKRIESVSFLLGSIATLPSLDFRANKDWPKLPAKAEFKCNLQGNEFEVQFNLPTKDVSLVEAVGQVVCTRVDGTIAYSPPMLIERLTSEKTIPKFPEPSPKTRGPEKDKRTADSNSRMRDRSNSPPSPKSPIPEFTGEVYQVQNIVQPERKVLNTTSKRSALSEPVPIGNLVFQRVLVPNEKLSASLIWNEAGDKLITLGNAITVIDYPSATHIESFSVPRPPVKSENWKQDLLITCDYGQVWKLDLVNMKFKSSLSFSRPIESYLDQNSNLLLVATDSEPRELYAWNETENKINPLDLTAGGRLGSPAEVCVARKGKYVFTWTDNRLNRFALANGKLTFEESVGTTFDDTTAPKFLNNSDDQGVALIARQMNEEEITSQIEVFASKKLATRYSVEVPDYVTCMVRDAGRQRYVFGGKDGLWSWSATKNEARKMPFPASATSVVAMALNPNGKTLAVLCGALGNGNLYWIDLTDSDRASK